MSAFSHKRTLTEKIIIKGVLSDDGKIITVEEKDDTRDIVIQDYLDKFLGDYIELAFQQKSELDVDDDEDESDED